VDGISSAGSSSENLGGQVVNTHENHGNVGTISQSVIAASGEYGRFASDGNGSHSLTILDSVSKANSYSYGLTRNVAGTTTATRFDTDGQIGGFKGAINRTSGANLTLNGSFLNDPRWKTEMCTQAGVTRGFCGTSMNLGDYIANKTGITVVGTPPVSDFIPPAVPSDLRLITN
jgi:hypothetical protein